LSYPDVDAEPLRDRNGSLDQGDILENVPFHKWKDGELVLSAGWGIVTSDGCDCEDYDRAVALGRNTDRLTIHVTPLRDAGGFPHHRIDEIRSGGHLRYFYIVGDDDVVGDKIADLWNEQPIPASLLVKLRHRATVADWQWRRLLIHFAVTRFHQTPQELFREGLLEEAGLEHEA
jgi:hypothetical protein